MLMQYLALRSLQSDILHLKEKVHLDAARTLQVQVRFDAKFENMISLSLQLGVIPGQQLSPDNRKLVGLIVHIYSTQKHLTNVNKQPK